MRLGRWAGVEERDAREWPSVSIAIVLKLKPLLFGRGGEEKALEKDSSDSERLRLRSIAGRGNGLLVEVNEQRTQLGFAFLEIVQVLKNQWATETGRQVGLMHQGTHEPPSSRESYNVMTVAG